MPGTGRGRPIIADIRVDRAREAVQYWRDRADAVDKAASYPPVMRRRP